MTKTYVASQVPALGPRRRHKMWQMRVARGLASSLTDSRPVRDHVTWLWEMGFSDGAIGAAAGLPQRTVWLARTGAHGKSRVQHAAMLRNVTHRPVPAQAVMLVPALGATRRIRALQAMGYTYAHLGAELSWAAPSFRRITSITQIKGETWFAIAELYDRLSGTPGPSELTMRRARNRGLASPIAWDGIDIDHPDSVPDLGCALEPDDDDDVRLARILAGEFDGAPTKAEKQAVYDHAIENGWLPAKVAEHLGMTKEAAERAILRRKAKLRKEAAA